MRRVQVWQVVARRAVLKRPHSKRFALSGGVRWSRQRLECGGFSAAVLLGCVMATLALAGCVRFQPKPISPVESAARLDARRLDDTGLKQFIAQATGHEPAAWPLAEWDLNSLTLATFYFHPSLEVVRAQWRVSQAGVKSAGARPNPTLGLTPGYNFSAASGVNPWLPFFNLDVPLETAGKRGKRMDEARHLGESARWNIVTVAWQIRSAVRASLLEFTVTDHRAGLLEAQVAAQEQAMQLLRQRLAVGAIASSELTPAQILLSKAQLDLSEAQSQRASARSRLAESLGVSVAALDGVKLAFDFSRRAADELTSAEARDVALRGRADIRSALAEYAAAEDELRLQIAKQYPDVHLNPGYQFDQGAHKWTLGITFELPVLNQNRGPIAEAEAKRAERAARFTGLQAKVIGEIDRAVAVYGAGQKNLATLGTLATAQHSQRESVEQQFKAGAVEQLDLLAARIESGVAVLAELDAQTKFQQALGALEDAVQRPLDLNLVGDEVTSLHSTGNQMEPPHVGTYHDEEGRARPVKGKETSQ